MGIGSKYNKCGCNKSTCNTCCNYASSGSCCDKYVQSTPTACCEATDTIFQAGMCLYPAATVVASSDDFYLSFSNSCNLTIPLNASEVFFYHAGAGLLKIKAFDGSVYTVELVNSARAGTVISEGDCILVSVEADAVNTISIGTRCLSGNFLAPELNQDQTMYILNGSGIPTGATITFTWEGEVGTYIVKSFVSVSNNVYSYVVTNTGSGLLPGTLVEAGDAADCSVQLEVLTEVDFCSLSNVVAIDNLSGCVNGTPRSLVPAGEGYVPIGKSDLTWDQQRLASTDCCVVTEGCLKFSGESCPDDQDVVVIQDGVGLECFTDAYNKAIGFEQNLGVNIDGFLLVVVFFDPITREVTLRPATDQNNGTLLEFPAGSQICLGECCDGCLTGPKVTDHRLILGDFDQRAVVGFVGGGIFYDTGDSYFLIGSDNTTGAYQILKLDGAYFGAPTSEGPVLPKMADPLVFRQKIWNTSEEGCNQGVELDVNYQLAFDPMPAGMTIDWEVAHFAQGSATLQNGVPNPFFDISTQVKSSGRIQGPSTTDATIDNTSFNIGGPGDAKTFPLISGNLRDFIELSKCDSAMSIVWFFIKVTTGAAPGELNVASAFRRRIKYEDSKFVASPPNNPASEGFNN